jgi:hypothetical protein
MAKRIGTIVIVSLVASAAFLLYQAHQAIAYQTEPASSQFGLAPGIARQRQALNPSSAQNIVKSAQSIAQPSATSSVYDNTALADEARLLTKQWQAQLVVGPGWLHILVQIERHDDSGGPLPNGQIIPASFQFDQWFELNANSQVIRDVSIMRGLDNNVIQVATYQDGLWRNSALPDGSTPNQGIPEAPSLDFNFVHDLSLANTWGPSVTVNRNEVVSAEGHRQVLFEIRQDFSPAEKLANFSAEVSAQTMSLTVDETTGQVIGTDEYAHFLNGDVLHTAHSQYVTVEHVSDAPAEILGFLK